MKCERQLEITVRYDMLIVSRFWQTESNRLNAMKTISMRIRGAKSELEEAGESTDGMVESTAKLREEILALSGVDIMQDANTFKSTYAIMDELADKWEDLSDIAQATIIELVAGKHQGNVFSSLMANFDTARAALETSATSSGSAMAEHAKWSKSLEARILKLKASWQSLAQTFMSSDFLKGAMDAITKLVDVLDALVGNFGTLGTIGLGVATKEIVGYISATIKASKATSDATSAITEAAEATANLASASTEAAESMANVASSATEVGESTSNVSSAATEAAEATTNLVSASTEVGESAANAASAATEAGESMANLASASTEAAESMANVASSATEATEATANLASASTEAAESAANLTSGGTEIVESIGNVASVATEGAEAMVNVGGAVAEVSNGATKAAGGFAKFASSAAGVITIIGLLAAAIGLAYNQYKKAKEEAAATRQETIRSSDEFLDAADSFEQAYVKYSGRTDLTVQEEAELESAIQGTIGALGDKSSALQDAVSSSNDYVAALERIAQEELKAAHRKANDKLDAAEGELKEAAIGWTGFDGSEIDVNIASGLTPDYDEVAKVAQEIGEKYYGTIGTSPSGTTSTVGFELPADADIDEIVDYYNVLLEYRDKLEELGLDDTDAFENTSKAIGKMEESVNTYVDALYDASKLEYEYAQQNGMPKTVDEYLKMRESILNSEGVGKQSFEIRKTIANTLDSEYGKIFDLSSAEVQARKFIGLIKGYGDGTSDGTNEIGTVETFLNMRTAVNNNECTVGEYLSQFDEIDKMTENWSDEEKELLNTSLGLDTDSIKQQYDDMYKYISRNYVDKYINKLGTSSAAPLGYSGDGVRYTRADYIADTEKAREKDIEEFLNSLTAEELSALVKIRTEIDWESGDFEKSLDKIQEQVKIDRALSFNANIAIDKEALELLNTALNESASASGLSSEAMDSLMKKYSELEGYNPATLFESTANGIKINRDELANLEKEYNNLTKGEVKEHLDTLVGEYNKLTKEIDDSNNAAERARLIAEREGYGSKIQELAAYQAQLEGLTGAYQRWINAQNSTEDYEGYEAVAKSRESIQDEIDRGFIGNATKEYIDLLSGEDLVGGTIDDYAKAWKKLDENVGSTSYSIHDFFTLDDDGNITATGIDRFFEGVRKDFEGSVAKFNKDTGKWTYDFSQENLQKIQDEWGLGIEAIQLLLEAAGSAGYDVDWDGILDNIDLDTSSFETLVSTAEAAQTAFNKLEGVEDVHFNFTATGVKEATSEVEKARKAYIDLITNKDGTINLEAEGAEEMRFMLTTLLIQKQQLSTPAIMKVDTSQIDSAKADVAEVVEAAQGLQTAYENYEIAISTGVDVEDAKADLDSAIATLEGTDANIRADLKLPSNEELQAAAGELGSIKVGTALDGTAIGALETQIQTQCTPEVIAKVTGLDETAIQNGEGGRKVVYTPEHSAVDNYVNGLTDVNKKIIFTYTTEGTKPNPSNIERTITYKYETEGTGPAAGTAHANGSAFARGTIGNSGRTFARGDWSIGGNGVALGGELGQELVVRDGRFFTIGDNGAEFFRYKKNDIVFNAAQTESLFKYGGIKGANPRGKMLASGSAFAEGNAFAYTLTEGGTPLRVTADKTDDGKITIDINWSADVGESDFASDRDDEKPKNKSPKKNNSDSEKEAKETIDWIETAIDRIERAIDKLDTKANSIYRSWSERNKNLVDEIDKVAEEIDLQQKAYDRYIQEAESVGLDAAYAKKVRNGTIDIEGLNDEALIDKIQKYKEWYEKAIDCQDAIVDLKEKESELYAQRFENIQTQYDGILQGYEHTEAMLNEYISQAEEKGYIVSKKYYQALVNNEKSNIAELKKEQAELIAERDNAVAEGKITKGSEAWLEQCAAIDEVTQAIEEGSTAILEYARAMEEIDWSIFDLIQERISDVTEEADFLIELMSNKKLFDDDGKLTSQGLATMALHAQNYNTNMYAADTYGEEVAKLDAQIAKDPYDQELINRRNELLELQRESILAAEDEKNAIRDMVEEGIELELDALDERIQKYEEALDSQKDLYDYQRKVEESSKNISSLQKQLSSYEGFDDEETKAKVQQLKVELEEAEADLRETEYDKYLSDQTALLDTLYDEYELILNQRLDNVDYLLEQVIESINASAGADSTIVSALGSEGAIAVAVSNNATSIKDTLTSEAKNVGVTLSSAMNNIWSTGEGNAKSVLTMYGEDFRTKSTTIITTLNGIKSSVNSMVSSLNKEATTKTKANKTTTSAKKNPTTTSSPKKTTKKSTSSGDGKPKIGDRVKYVSGQYYYDSQGKKPLGSHKKGEYVYITNINTKDWATHGYHISTGKKLGSGDLGWLKLNQISGYATGKNNFLNDEVAWTQEDWEKKGEEFIVRPSDGAILTPIAKGDSVLTSAASKNIWDMANSPAEFIKDNLNLSATGIPNNSTVQSNYTQHLDKVVFNFPNVKNYEEMLYAMQKDRNFESLIQSMTINPIAGKSSLGKGKSIR